MNFEQILLYIVVGAAVAIPVGLMIRDTGPTWKRRIPIRWVWSDINREMIREKLYVPFILGISLLIVAVPIVVFFGVWALTIWLFGQFPPQALTSDVIFGFIIGIGITSLVVKMGLRRVGHLYVPMMFATALLFGVLLVAVPTLVFLVGLAGWMGLSYLLRP